MSEIKKDKIEKVAYDPRRGSSINIHIDLQDLCQKTLTRGPMAVIGETLFNLCLLANDAKGGNLRGSDFTKDNPRKSKTRRS